MGTTRTSPGRERIRRGIIVSLAGAAVVGAVAVAHAAGAPADPPDGPDRRASGDRHAAPDHAAHGHGDHHRGITSKPGEEPAAADLVRTEVVRRGRTLIFTERVTGDTADFAPETNGGELANAQVTSYVWPLSADPSSVGFEKGSGVLALAATRHPDFDDTPLYDEDGDGRKDDDGARWHSHWVVLVPDTTRGDGALKVRDIPEGSHPALPKTWPGIPVFIDSPNHVTKARKHTVRIEVPTAHLNLPRTFHYDGVTAALRVNGDLHDPLLRVENVLDVASGDLSLPGTVR